MRKKILFDWLQFDTFFHNDFFHIFLKHRSVLAELKPV